MPSKKKVPKKKTTSRKTASKKTASKKTTSKRSAPKEKAAKKTASNKSALKKAASKTSRNTASKKTAKKKAVKKWSGKVTETSDAMDLKGGVFKLKDPKKIAASIKRSAEKSNRKKTGPFQSAMSMLNFYENRGGNNISAAQKKVLDKAKDELRNLFGKE